MTSNVKTEGEKTEGVVMAEGGVAAGITLYLNKGVPVFDYNCFDDHTIIKGDKVLAAGDATLEVDFDYQGDGNAGGPATVTLKINGKQAGTAKMKATVPGRFGIDTFGVGEDTGQPVTPDYSPPFKFTGQLESVTFEIK